ncbi:MAG: hypothetical protein RLZZ584_733 [Pseudomonadota bacterium]|jgi:16S rRNA (cytidine1402-2'-O)-methyltransferase
MTAIRGSATVRGRLLLVPNVLDQSLLGPVAPGGEGADVLDSLPLGVLRLAAGLRHWVAETPKVARAFLKRVDGVVALAQPLQDLVIAELPRANKGRPGVPPAATAQGDAGQDPWAGLLAPALAGHDIGLLSDAGLPAVADPGAELVRAAHRAGLVVVPLAGPSSLLLALAASGLNGQSFAFQGYLPVPADERGRRIQELEGQSRRWKQTQLCIETPYRNMALLDALLAGLQPQTLLSVSSGLTSAAGWSRTASVQQWRQQLAVWGGGISAHMPAVFAFLAT